MGLDFFFSIVGSDESEDGLLCLICCSGFVGEFMGVCIGEGLGDRKGDDFFAR